MNHVENFLDILSWKHYHLEAKVLNNDVIFLISKGLEYTRYIPPSVLEVMQLSSFYALLVAEILLDQLDVFYCAL